MFPSGGSLLLAFLIKYIGSVSAVGSFIQPPAAGSEGDYQDNPRYQIGSTVTLHWNSESKIATDVVLIEDYPKLSNSLSPYYSTILLKNNSQYNVMPWTVSLDGLSSDIPEGQDAVLYLAIMYSGTTKTEIYSHYFNVTPPRKAPDSSTLTKSTTMTTTTTTTSVSSTPTGLSSSPTPDPTPGTVSNPTPTVTSNTNSGSILSTGATAGIAVGATLGGVMAFGGLGLLLWRHRRKGNAEPGPPTLQDALPPKYRHMMSSQGYVQTRGELSAEQIHEAP